MPGCRCCTSSPSPFGEVETDKSEDRGVTESPTAVAGQSVFQGSERSRQQPPFQVSPIDSFEMKELAREKEPEVMARMAIAGPGKSPAEMDACLPTIDEQSSKILDASTSKPQSGTHPDHGPDSLALALALEEQERTGATICHSLIEQSRFVRRSSRRTQTISRYGDQRASQNALDAFSGQNDSVLEQHESHVPDRTSNDSLSPVSGSKKGPPKKTRRRVAIRYGAARAKTKKGEITKSQGLRADRKAQTKAAASKTATLLHVTQISRSHDPVPTRPPACASRRTRAQTVVDSEKPRATRGRSLSKARGTNKRTAAVSPRDRTQKRLRTVSPLANIRVASGLTPPPSVPSRDRSMSSSSAQMIPTRVQQTSPCVIAAPHAVVKGPFAAETAILHPGQHETLAAASKTIMAKTAIKDKPEPFGRPEVWAETRQALCETALYYQAWQGACYISKGILYSFMFDSHGHERDLIDHDVVIARAGGSMARDKVSGDMYQTKDQKENAQTAAVRAAIALQNPIVIFCGKENADVPTVMPARYCSLGWFKATHIWAEKTWNKRGVPLVNFKYRFEKLDTETISWWTPVGGKSISYSVGSFDLPVTSTCPACQKPSPQVYLEGWMCLNHECARHFLLPSGQQPEDTMLNYDPRFLKQKTHWQNEQAPFALRPDLPNPSNIIGDDVTYAMTRGMCCPNCGKCTSRFLWRGWLCSNNACGFRYFPEHPLIPASILHDPWHPVGRNFASSHDSTDASFVKSSVSFSHNYRIVSFEIPGLEGSIHHLIANKTVLEEQCGPNQMFETLQQEDCGLERRRFVTGKEEFMTAFSNNRGMPYKFVASGDSTSFMDAPWPLTETRSRLNWAARLTLGNAFTKDNEFNELLTIGYFDGQNIKYHDDGESGLGPTVASLSLGYPADMHFRVKAKHWTGVSKTGVFIDSRPLPGTLKYEERLAAFDKLHPSSEVSKCGHRKTTLLESFQFNAPSTPRIASSADQGLQTWATMTCAQDQNRSTWSLQYRYSQLTVDMMGANMGLEVTERPENEATQATSACLTEWRDSATEEANGLGLLTPESAAPKRSLARGRHSHTAAAPQSNISNVALSDSEPDFETPAPKRRKSSDKTLKQVAPNKTAVLKKIAKDIGLTDNTKDRKPLLRLRLSHGDIVVMHGRQIQEYLEHQVDPLGRLRFALTCRTILPEHLKENELPSYQVKPDDGHYNGEAIRDLQVDQYGANAAMATKMMHDEMMQMDVD